MYSSVQPKCLEELLEDIIWNNKYIVVNIEPICYKKWIDKGIVQIKDIISCEGNILTMNEIRARYNLEVSLMEYNSLISAFPKVWLNRLAENEPKSQSNSQTTFIESVPIIKSIRIIIISFSTTISS